MDRAEVRQQVLEAIERGEIPPGGPSELAVYDLLDDVPAGYWERWSEGSEERAAHPPPEEGRRRHLR